MSELLNSRLIGPVSQSQLKPNSNCSVCSPLDTNAGAAGAVVAVAKMNINICDNGMRAAYKDERQPKQIHSVYAFE